MDLKYLDKLSRLCQKHGIRHIKTTEFELSFELQPSATQEASTSTEAPTPEYSDEDILSWSSQAAS